MVKVRAVGVDTSQDRPFSPYRKALRKLPDLTPRRKQPRVSGHPTHNPGIFVMYLSSP